VIENIFNWTETAWNLIWGIGFDLVFISKDIRK